MFLIISGILFFQEFLLWSLLVRSKKSMSDEEKFVEDNWQMEWLKRYNSRLNYIRKIVIIYYFLSIPNC